MNETKNVKPQQVNPEPEHHKFDERLVRIEKMNKIREQGVSPYPRSDFKPNISSMKMIEMFNHLNGEQVDKESDVYRYAGRIVMVRDFGKGGFLLLADQDGRFQAFISKQDLTEQEFFIYKHLDIGDFVGVEGKCFKTRTGDLAIHAKKLILMTKSLRPLPEKFHGLTDVEARYRQRVIKVRTCCGYDRRWCQ